MRSSCVAHAASAFGQHATENHALLKPSLEKMIRGDDGSSSHPQALCAPSCHVTSRCCSVLFPPPCRFSFTFQQLRAFADRPGTGAKLQFVTQSCHVLPRGFAASTVDTGPGIIYRSHPSPARVSRPDSQPVQVSFCDVHRITTCSDISGLNDFFGLLVIDIG